MSRALSSSFSSVLARRAKCTRQSVINMKTRCMRRTNLQNLTTKLAIAVKQSHLMETHTHTHTVKDNNNYCYYTRLTNSSMGYGYVFFVSMSYRTVRFGGESAVVAGGRQRRDVWRTVGETAARQRTTERFQ